MQGITLEGGCTERGCLKKPKQNKTKNKPEGEIQAAAGTEFPPPGF